MSVSAYDLNVNMVLDKVNSGQIMTYVVNDPIRLLANEVTRLRARVAELEAEAAADRERHQAECAAVIEASGVDVPVGGMTMVEVAAAFRERIAELEDLLREVRYCSGVELDDARMDYLLVQIDRVTWDEIGAAVAATVEEEVGDE